VGITPVLVVEMTPVLVVEMTPVLVVEMTPVLVVEMTPVFAVVGADIAKINVAAQRMGLRIFIVRAPGDEPSGVNGVGSECCLAEHSFGPTFK
jgi:hypothetical protein